MESNLYTYSIWLDDEGKTVKDVVYANNLMEAFNIIDGIFGLDDSNYKDLEIERLRKGQ